ncbi:molybdopterin biosynthesis protein [Desulfogranum mediterraneum]|uniref:molybdopterin biosynthesis protein n=1 Tax=Desulfogranum mediterraneum TaxID=160661 RepID=UPI0003F7F487|nr:molybdopterin biosynthesis protein [Desulfogranum mediterraneum]
MQRKIYLNMHSRSEAQQLFWSRFADRQTGAESVPVQESGERVLAGPVHARLSSPSFHGAAMDGIAVRAEETFGASDEHPLTLDIAAGQGVPINTGYPLPEDKDSVIMIENVLLSADGSQGVIRAPVFPWQHVRKVGEDIVATELLFPTGHLVQPADIAAMITAGCTRVEVRKRPELTILPTGSELVSIEDIDGAPPAGKTIESNSAVLAGLARRAGALTRVQAITADDYPRLKGQVEEVLATDTEMVVINAGSSAGSADYTARIIEELGEVLVHGVTIMPGKPTILGVVQGKPVVGIPGYPVSAIIAFEQFVLPLLARWQGLEPAAPVRVQGLVAKDIPSRSGIEEFRRMVMGRIGENYVALPLKKGSGAITTLTRANAMLHIDAASEGVSRGDQVQLELLQSVQAIEQTLLCTGSHDLSLDLLRDRLRRQSPACHLASSHLGSLGGIMALKQSMTHIAGSHLLDPEDGSYNTTFVDRYLGDREIAIITLAHRQQGLFIQPGNPREIRSIQDLSREDLVFINRQSGSGTRVLLDYQLEQEGIDPDGIKGYDHDEYTHMAVAVAVLAGKADCGLGIMSAARALGLDFIPVTEERYDLLLPVELLELPMIQALLAILENSGFQQELEEMGGYSTRECGRRVR